MKTDIHVLTQTFHCVDHVFPRRCAAVRHFNVKSSYEYYINTCIVYTCIMLEYEACIDSKMTATGM